MIIISTSPNCKSEKEYIFSTLFGDFLGIDYKIDWVENQKIYSIQYNEKVINIKDAFFSSFTSNEYLKEDSIPIQITQTKIDNFTSIPVIYGTSEYKKTENGFELGLDIFGSSFFMLTRWEEYVLNVKDEHKRFPGYASLACKNNFLERPIVNEYLELFWTLLKKIGYPEHLRQQRNYEFHFSHDVDHPFLFYNFKSYLRQSAYHLLKRKDFSQTLKFGINYFSFQKDPYDTFDELMDISEKNNVKSHFNFMTCSKGKYDEGYSYDKNILKVVEKIKNRGHHIGIHPSYDTFMNPVLIKKQKEDLEAKLQIEIIEGRQHYLRFSAPHTWQHWEDAGLQIDSTLGYGDFVGFRAGTCYSYHPFNFLTRQKLKLLEIPLLVMDGTLINRMNLTPIQVKQKINHLRLEARKYNGTFSLLWHNSSFFLPTYKGYETYLSEIIQ